MERKISGVKRAISIAQTKIAETLPFYQAESQSTVKS